MQSNDLIIEIRKRELLSKYNRNYRIIYGIIILLVGIIMIPRTATSIFFDKSFIVVAAILTGIYSIIYGSIGKEILVTKYSVKLDSDSLRIKKSFSREVLINFNQVKAVKFFPLKFEIYYNDYVKTYEFPWMPIEDFEKLKTSLSEVCIQKSIEIT